MNFVGTGRRLTAADFRRAADFLGTDEATVRAVIEVEAASYGFDSKNRPRILFEPHVFHKELGPGTKRDQAVSQGLAYAKWGTRPYPSTMDARYDQLERAIRIDRDKALRSASWGLGQVMGFNHSAAGYASVVGFVEGMRQGEAEQVLAMCAFIKANDLDKHLRAKNWAAFARGYNGPGYATHDYHGKLARAYARYSATGGHVDTYPVLRRNSSNRAAVSELQSLLNQRGYGLVVDGRFGAQTEVAVHDFQAKNGLLVDGIVGKATWAALRSDDSTTVDPEEAIPAPSGSGHGDDEVVISEAQRNAIVATIMDILRSLGVVR